MADTDGLEAAVVEGDVERRRQRIRGGFLGFLPGFVYILALSIIGQFMFSDPRATLFNVGGYQLAWSKSCCSPLSLPPWLSRSRSPHQA
jgi:hypothetical protein